MYYDSLQNCVFIFFPQLDFFLILVVSKTLLSLRSFVFEIHTILSIVE